MNIEEIKLLQSTFEYNKDTGLVSWKVNRKGKGICKKQERSIGDVELTLATNYYVVCFNSKTYYIHKLAFVLVEGREVFQADHIDQNKLNNKWNNLRPADYFINSKNVPLRVDNTSGQVGVSKCLDRDRWRARISINGKCVLIGWYKTFQEAVEARKDAELKFGYHVNHGAIPRRQQSGNSI